MKLGFGESPIGSDTSALLALMLKNLPTVTAKIRKHFVNEIELVDLGAKLRYRGLLSDMPKLNLRSVY